MIFGFKEGLAAILDCVSVRQTDSGYALTNLEDLERITVQSWSSLLSLSESRELRKFLIEISNRNKSDRLIGFTSSNVGYKVD